MTERNWTPEPWEWITRTGDNPETQLVHLTDEWEVCGHRCFGWAENDPISRGDTGTPGHEHRIHVLVCCGASNQGEPDLICSDANKARIVACVNFLADFPYLEECVVVDKQENIQLCRLIGKLVSEKHGLEYPLPEDPPESSETP